MKLTPLARLTPAQLWRSALRPSVAWIVMLASALAAGWAMQASIDRLAAAADARARLERQTSQLEERFQSAAKPVPALQALRASHDEAVQKAASRSRWIVWGSLAWLAGLGLASVLTLQRRARSDRAESTAAAGSASTAAPAGFDAPSAAAGAMPASTREAADRQWRALRQEIEALRTLMDAPDAEQSAHQETTTRAATAALTAAVVGRIEPAGASRPPFELLERAPQLELRLAA